VTEAWSAPPKLATHMIRIGVWVRLSFQNPCATATDEPNKQTKKKKRCNILM
jgi:hypothetical protein